jgi:hypothetical protein
MICKGSIKCRGRIHPTRKGSMNRTPTMICKGSIKCRGRIHPTRKGSMNQTPTMICKGSIKCRGRIHPTRGFDKSNPYSTNCVGATFTPLEIPPREFLTSISNGVYGRPNLPLGRTPPHPIPLPHRGEGNLLGENSRQF